MRILIVEELLSLLRLSQAIHDEVESDVSRLLLSFSQPL